MASENGANVGTTKNEDLKAEARRKRVALLVNALGCDALKATAMADKLAGLSDADFQAHTDYMAQQLAGYMKATGSR